MLYLLFIFGLCWTSCSSFQFRTQIIRSSSLYCDVPTKVEDGAAPTSTSPATEELNTPATEWKAGDRYVQCGACNTVYLIQPEQLGQRGSRVHCR